MFKYALTRKPGKNFTKGITTSDPGIPDYKLILKQYKDYVKTLSYVGLEIIELDSHPGYPDGYFIEDTAVITPDVAIITNPGAYTRKGEEDTVEPILSRYRKTIRIKDPGTLDGGDVFNVGTYFFIGISNRTNIEGAKQLGRILERYGNMWTAVHIKSGLHLKSSVNYVGKKTLIITEDFATLDAFNAYDKIILSKADDYAANTLFINDHLITPKGFPDTWKKLKSLGFKIIEIDVSEARMMDGGLTCMSLRF